jgi:methylenetetrahydrofolate reductase (NADPH)
MDNRNKLQFSFEFFPPKTEAMEVTLWQSIELLQQLKPRFVSVTYGALGSTRDRTHRIIARILKDTKLIPASHLTCIGSTAAEIREVALSYWQIGVRHIVALRGDLPEGYKQSQFSYSYAFELVEALKAIADFEISVAGYPEKHPEARTMQEDLDNLKRKIDAGATRVITQFFFNNDRYYEFLNHAERMNLQIEIVPGILPIINFNQVIKFSEQCNSKIPENYYAAFASCNSEDEKRMVALHLALKQCLDLEQNGVNNFHFYTLNRAEMVTKICQALIKGELRDSNH